MRYLKIIEPAGTIEISNQVNSYHQSEYFVTRESTYNQGFKRHENNLVDKNALVYNGFLSNYLEIKTFRIRHGDGHDEGTIYKNSNEFYLWIPVDGEGNAMVYNHNEGGSVRRCSEIYISGTINANIYTFNHLKGTANGNVLYDTEMRLRQEEERQNFMNDLLIQRANIANDVIAEAGIDFNPIHNEIRQFNADVRDGLADNWKEYRQFL